MSDTRQADRFSEEQATYAVRGASAPDLDAGLAAIRNVLKTLPRRPGVYRMQDAAEAAGAIVWGKSEARLPGTLSLSAPGFPSQTQLMTMDLAGIAISSGSACSSGKTKPSHVLTAMGADDALASSGIRVSLGWNSTDEDADAFCREWPDAYRRIKARAA